MHVQFNDEPTIILPSNSEPSHINTVNKKTDNVQLRTKNYNSLPDRKPDETIALDLQNLHEIEKDTTTINRNNNVIVSEPKTTEITLRTNNVSKADENVPPPVNLATLPPRSSLHQVPLELLTPSTKPEPIYSNITKRPASTELTTSNVTIESPISLVGNMIEKDQKKNDPILVSTAYTNLPSPITVPSPSEIPNSPLILNNNPHVQSYRPLSAHEATIMAQRPLPGHMYMQPVIMPNSVMSSRVSYVQQPVFLDAYVHQHFDVLNYSYYPSMSHNLPPNMAGSIGSEIPYNMATQMPNIPMNTMPCSSQIKKPHDSNIITDIPNVPEIPFQNMATQVISNEMPSIGSYNNQPLFNIHNNMPVDDINHISTNIPDVSLPTSSDQNMKDRYPTHLSDVQSNVFPSSNENTKLSCTLNPRNMSESNVANKMPSSVQIKKRSPPPVPTKPNRLSGQFSEPSRLSGYYPEPSRLSAHFTDPGNQNDPGIYHDTVKTNMHASISSESIGKKELFAPNLDKVTRNEVGLECNYFCSVV